MSTMRDLAREIDAASVLRKQLTALNDEQLIVDSIEGETSLNEMIASMIRQDGEDEAHVTALKAYADDMDKRKKRIEARIETRRGLLAVAMEMSGKPKAETAFGTITLGVTAPKVIVTEESEIPTGFWITPPPQLDKKTLLAALKAQRVARDEAMKIEDAEERSIALSNIKTIRGAELSNGGAKITIRRA
jgi:hypothetical protein